jgi:hypothetical protein
MRKMELERKRGRRGREEKKESSAAGIGEA